MCEPLKQLTFEAFPIQLMLFEHSVPNYHISTSGGHVYVVLNAQRVPMVFQQVVTYQVAWRKVIKANEYRGLQHLNHPSHLDQPHLHSHPNQTF